MAEALTGKTIVIIGGTSGIGLEAAAVLARQGAKILVASRSERNQAEARRRLGAAVDIRSLDVSDEAAVCDFFAGIGALDHLVTTAAVPVAGPFLDQDTTAVRRLVESKFWGQYYSARYGAPKIRAGGSIILFSGIVSRKPLPGMSAFAAVGGAIESLTRVLAVELAPLRVNCIAPGVVDTPAWAFLPESHREQQLATIGNSLPVKRVGRPSDIAEALLMLMTNGFMTGAVVDVDGGHAVT